MVLGIGETGITIVIRAKDAFSKTFNKASLSLANFRKAALGAAVVGVALAIGFKKAIDKGIELESAMVGVRKTTGLAADEIELLRKEFIDLSQVMPVSAIDLAKIGEVAGQLGIQGTENIRSFTETVSKMSIATELTAEASALALAKISNAMGLPIKEAEKLGSAINELSNISAASSTEIISAMVRVAGSAKTLGLSTELITGLSAALIAAGEPAQRAGTKLRSAFDSVVKKMDEVVAFMPDFKTAFEKDADEAILALITRLSGIEDPLERQRKAMDIFGTVGASAINKLSNNLPEMNRLIEAAAKEFENATSLQKEYDIASQSTANQIQLVKNQFAALQFEIADVLIPVIRELLPVFVSIIKWFKSLPEPVKKAIIILGLVTVAVTLLAGAIALVTLVSSPWLLIIGGIILAITGIILLVMNWEKVMVFLSKVFIKAALGMDNVWQLFKDGFIIALEVMKNVAFTVWNLIINFIENKINSMIDLINFLIKGLNKIPKVNIPLIPRVDFSAVKGQLTDIGALSERLRIERGERATQFESAGNQVIVNIEQAIGLDPDDVTESIQDKLDTLISV